MARLVDLIIKHNIRKNRIPSNPNLSIEDIKLLANSHKQNINLSSSPHITMEYILANMSYNWDTFDISENTNITMDIINHNHLINWNYLGIIYNPDFTEKYLTVKFIDKLQIHDIYCDHFCECNCLGINLSYIGQHKNISADYFIDFVCSNYNELYQKKNDGLDYSIIFTNSNYTLEHIEKNIDYYEFEFKSLHVNPNININFILKYKTEKWDWHLLPRNPGLSVKDIKENIDLPWGRNAEWWNNPNITPFDLIHNKIKKPSMWKVVSLSPHTSIEYIMANKNLPWDWSNVSRNPNLTVKIVMDNPELKWDYKAILSNLMTYHPIVYSRTITNLIKEKSLIIRELSDLIIQFI